MKLVLKLLIFINLFHLASVMEQLFPHIAFLSALFFFLKLLFGINSLGAIADIAEVIMDKADKKKFPNIVVEKFTYISILIFVVGLAIPLTWDITAKQEWKSLSAIMYEKEKSKK